MPVLTEQERKYRAAVRKARAERQLTLLDEYNTGRARQEVPNNLPHLLWSKRCRASHDAIREEALRRDAPVLDITPDEWMVGYGASLCDTRPGRLPGQKLKNLYYRFYGWQPARMSKEQHNGCVNFGKALDYLHEILRQHKAMGMTPSKEFILICSCPLDEGCHIHWVLSCLATKGFTGAVQLGLAAG